MTRILKNRRALVVMGVVAMMAFAGVAVGFLSTTGSGSGSASSTAAATGLNIHSANVVFADLDTSKTVHILADNTNTSPQAVPTVYVTVTPTSSDCPAGSFTPAGTSVASGVNVPKESTDTEIGSFSLSLNNLSNAEQNACLQGASIAYSTTAPTP